MFFAIFMLNSCIGLALIWIWNPGYQIEHCKMSRQRHSAPSQTAQSLSFFLFYTDWNTCPSLITDLFCCHRSWCSCGFTVGRNQSTQRKSICPTYHFTCQYWGSNLGCTGERPEPYKKIHLGKLALICGAASRIQVGWNLKKSEKSKTSQIFFSLSKNFTLSRKKNINKK